MHDAGALTCIPRGATMDEFRRIGVALLKGSAGCTVVLEVLDHHVYEMHVVQELFEEITQAIQDTNAAHVVLDLVKLDHVSSQFLNRLLDLKDDVASRGGELRLCGLRPELNEIFEITHLNRQLAIAQNRQAALASFGRAAN